VSLKDYIGQRHCSLNGGVVRNASVGLTFYGNVLVSVSFILSLTCLLLIIIVGGNVVCALNSSLLSVTSTPTFTNNTIMVWLKLIVGIVDMLPTSRCPYLPNVAVIYKHNRPIHRRMKPLQAL
jgi:hypothetical protein